MLGRTLKNTWSSSGGYNWATPSLASEDRHTKQLETSDGVVLGVIGTQLPEQ